MRKILFLCTGNSCRSQMAEGFAKECGGGNWEVYSAGVSPAGYVHPKAVQVMQEVEIDISDQISKSMDQVPLAKMDLVVTVCSQADRNCPTLSPNVHKIHWPIADPVGYPGSEDELLEIFRKTRDEICRRVDELWGKEVIGTKIAFVANSLDGTHCFQAALQMILQYFEPHETWNFERLDAISGKEEGKWTWPTRSFLWLLKRGYEVRVIEEFDYLEFGRRGADYIIDKCGREVAQAQVAHSDIESEKHFAAEFAKSGCLEYRIPSWRDLGNFLCSGYLLICNVNANPLVGRRGYSGHFVVPCEIGADQIILHDPGLPPQVALPIPRKMFEKGWGYPSRHERNVAAIKTLNSK